MCAVLLVSEEMKTWVFDAIVSFIGSRILCAWFEWISCSTGLLDAFVKYGIWNLYVHADPLWFYERNMIHLNWRTQTLHLFSSRPSVILCMCQVSTLVEIPKSSSITNPKVCATLSIIFVLLTTIENYEQSTNNLSFDLLASIRVCSSTPSEKSRLRMQHQQIYIRIGTFSQAEYRKTRNFRHTWAHTQTLTMYACWYTHRVRQWLLLRELEHFFPQLRACVCAPNDTTTHSVCENVYIQHSPPLRQRASFVLRPLHFGRRAACCVCTTWGTQACTYESPHAHTARTNSVWGNCFLIYKNMYA